MDTRQYIYNLEDIDVIASKVLEQLNSKVVLFNGNMGAGKTTLVKALLKAMKSEDSVTSPTFSIVNEYQIPNDSVYHFDFYRIEDIEEAYNFGIEDYFATNHWLFIEWSERVASLIPDDVCIVDISIESPIKRALKLTIDTNQLTETM
ncbi:tRNA (adenosine(37)-N6)-threonylcarbamoyltransferase complex ATPase subunit type 1 TsaE [Winogradskyella haliclonae]|uniref:tRNA threonylcarbamoyladenosine biosynthesis protein TsaE n=1 Tax=Winogradskyella haliclonae TaxID=2048558 RepID=A0ABQ2BYD7_9FLAO|nr:tRNA (adenosine(37)-N6)-threonylcarbamoyltransferase complex ATPase subunit type 1 TsaE [Winogradskyella haliclonae]GGI57529.1 tRNA (adenosine(37)-N6)-threonylcarbamoyltransferase complex ATPase subunit type 1 TsaE [Winogradskyella haliclonae]